MAGGSEVTSVDPTVAQAQWLHPGHIVRIQEARKIGSRILILEEPTRRHALVAMVILRRLTSGITGGRLLEGIIYSGH